MEMMKQKVHKIATLAVCAVTLFPMHAAVPDTAMNMDFLCAKAREGIQYVGCAGASALNSCKNGQALTFVFKTVNDTIASYASDESIESLHDVYCWMQKSDEFKVAVVATLAVATTYWATKKMVQRMKQTA